VVISRMGLPVHGVSRFFQFRGGAAQTWELENAKAKEQAIIAIPRGEQSNAEKTRFIVLAMSRTALSDFPRTLAFVQTII